MHSSVQLVFAEHPLPSDPGMQRRALPHAKRSPRKELAAVTGPSLETRGVNKPGISLQPKRGANAQSLDQKQMDEDPSSLTGNMLTWLIRGCCHKHLEGKLYSPMCTPHLGKSCPSALNTHTHTQPSLYPKLAASWGSSRFQNPSGPACPPP